MWICWTQTLRPLGARPRNSPVWVPRAVQRKATRSPFAEGVIEVVGQVREGAAQPAHHPFDGLGSGSGVTPARGRPAVTAVIDAVRRDQLVSYLEAAGPNSSVSALTHRSTFAVVVVLIGPLLFSIGIPPDRCKRPGLVESCSGKNS